MAAEVGAGCSSCMVVVGVPSCGSGPGCTASDAVQLWGSRLRRALWGRGHQWVPFTSASGRSSGQWPCLWHQGWACGKAAVSVELQRGRWGKPPWENSLNFNGRPPFYFFFSEQIPPVQVTAPNKWLASLTAQLSNQTGDYQFRVCHDPTPLPSLDVTWLPNFSGYDPDSGHSLTG